MGRPRVPIDPVADLARRLGRGVAFAQVRTCTQRWWADHGLADHPAAVGKRIALALLEQPRSEAKAAGILVLQEVLGDQLRTADLAPFARLFARGHLADATLADWFAHRVLATLLARVPGRTECARQLAQWRAAETAWQRRAACLAFSRIVGDGDAGLAELACTMCATVVWSPDRLDQLAAGTLLRELSRADPDRVQRFLHRHALLMSKDGIRVATAKLAPDRRAALLALHRRATSLRYGGEED